MPGGRICGTLRYVSTIINGCGYPVLMCCCFNSVLVLCTLPVAASFLFIGVLGRQHNLAALMEVDQL